MFQARSISTPQDVGNINIESFEGDAKNIAETLVQTIKKLQSMKQKHNNQNTDAFITNSGDIETIMSKYFITKKGDMNNFLPSILYKLVNCKNFTNTLNKTEELFAVIGVLSSSFSQSLTIISDEINDCAQKDPYPRIFCQLGLLGTIYERGENFKTVAINFTQYAAASVKTIATNVVSCLKQP